MQPSSKKMVAAISAVMQFIQEEAPALPVAAAPPPVPVFSPWRVAGRQDAMMFRTLWQRRLGRGC
jgi:hypothetical protein